ncbi:histidine phosphatase family protein, partial [Candidatus Roizmanbacteria bacterium]|nr:histidine phosphatase family protein [Candidatus Roizmanbacteria bacterium]
FVRHGESTYNRINKHQHGQVALSALGQKQADQVAERFRSIEVDIIIASDFVRARQTAEKIRQTTGKKLIFSQLIREIKRPTEIENRYFHDPLSIKVRELIHQKATDPNWHYSDEENFSDLRRRATKFISEVEKRKENNIAIVTHSMFLKLMVGLMMFGERFDYELHRSIQRSFDHRNTGVTICEKNENGHWKLLVWNDHAHLGE